MADRFKAVSLFSGAMGLDIGLEQTGCFEVLSCVESVPAFCRTIERNRDAGRTACLGLRVYQGDICDLQPSRLMDDLGLGPGDLDLLVGGPPCQSFSTTGRRRTTQDRRGTLLWQFLRFVEAFQPRFFIMENVRGLLSAALRHRPIKDRPERGGPPLAPDEEPGSVVRAFIADLHGAYRLDCFEVNAVNYGAPQLRERALFIGNRLGRVVEFPEPTHGPTGATRQLGFLQDGTAPRPFRTLGDAISDLVEAAPVLMDFSPRKKGYLSLIPPGGNWRCLPPEVAKESMGRAYFAKGGRSGWWRRLSFDLPCPTIVTMPNHAGTSLCHPQDVRALSIRECARVQEFPDDWEFVGTPKEQYEQIGNAVPVRLGRVAGEILAAYLGDAVPGEPDAQSAAAPVPLARLVYLKSHIRTRRWFKGGKEFVWRDGEDNRQAMHAPARTERRERPFNRG